MKKTLSLALTGAICVFSLLASPAAQAQAFPNKPIRIIIPAAAGGPTDTIGRLLGKVMSEQNGVPVVVENKAGASGSIGVYATVQAPADGYTLLVSTPDAVTVYPLVKKNVPYRYNKDLTAITLVASTPYVFGVNAQSPARTMQEFVALAKSQKLAMAAPGHPPISCWRCSSTAPASTCCMCRTRARGRRCSRSSPAKRRSPRHRPSR